MHESLADKARELMYNHLKKVKMELAKWVDINDKKNNYPGAAK